MANGGFDVIIGNPPYVEYKDVKTVYTIRGFDTGDCGDLYAFCMERSVNLLRRGGFLGLIVPISVFGTDGFQSLQKFTLANNDHVWASCYANRPSQLFDGAQKRLTIVISRRGTTDSPAVYSSRYHRWKREEFSILFKGRLQYAPPHSYYSVFPSALEKFGSDVEVSAFNKMVSHSVTFSESIRDDGTHPFYYTRKFGYFLAFLDEVPRITNIKSGRRVEPSELKQLNFASRQSRDAAVAVLSSSTFFWFWNVLSDCRNLNRRDLLAFPMDLEAIPASLQRQLGALGRKYLNQLKTTSTTMLKSGLHIETFDYARCKLVIDEVDRAIAEHFAFTDAERDFIVNYDLKYRMGLDDAESDE